MEAVNVNQSLNHTQHIVMYNKIQRHMCTKGLEPEGLFTKEEGEH